MTKPTKPELWQHRVAALLTLIDQLKTIRAGEHGTRSFTEAVARLDHTGAGHGPLREIAAVLDGTTPEELDQYLASLWAGVVASAARRAA